MRLSFGFLSAFLAIGLALCISAKADAHESASASPEGGEPLVLVCRLSGGDLPVSGLEYLSELVQQEVTRTESLVVVKDLATCARPNSAAVTARAAGAHKVITGRVALLGDLYLVELALVDADLGLTERREEVEFIGELRDLRVPVRTAAQRLLGTGGRTSLSESFIHISSSPPGARVLLNGLLEGRAPIRVRVAPGDHRIEAIIPGHAIWQQDVNVKRNETLSLNAAMVEAAQTAHRKADGRFVLLTFSVPYAVAFSWGALYMGKVSSERPYIGAFLVGAPTTYYVVSRIMEKSEIEVGQAWMTVSSGLWGAAWGMMGAGFSGFDAPRPYFGLSMAASSVALSATISMTAGRDISRKRVSLINLGGFLGSAIGLGIPYLLNQDQEQIYLGGLLAGGVIGSATAINATSGLDYVSQEEVVLGPIQVTPLMTPMREVRSPGTQGKVSIAYGATVTYGFY